MQIWIRLFRVGLRALHATGSVSPGHVSRLELRVAPGDIDVNGHMNNGRYLTVMDLGRIDLLIRTGVYREMRRRGATGVVAAQRVRYRVPLGLGARFRLESRILGWPDEGVIFEHRVLRLQGGRETLAATATVRFVFTARRRGLARPTPTEVLRGARWYRASPSLPDGAAAWLASERTAGAAAA